MHAPRLPLADVRLEAPVLRPPKFLAIGLNYADHVAESGMDKPPVPDLLQQAVDLRRRAARPDPLPRVSTLLDYEGELGLRDRPALPARAAPSARTR